MDKKALLLLIYILISTESFAQIGQKTSTRRKNSSVSFGMESNHNDLGYGFNYTSKYYKNKIAFNLGVILSFKEEIPELGKNQQRYPYQIIKIGAKSGGLYNSKSLVRNYIDAGLFFVIPNSQFSDNTALGGYFNMGWESFVSKNQEMAHFIEMGVLGSQAIAEKVLGKPSYTNGFSVKVGWRYFF